VLGPATTGDCDPDDESVGTSDHQPPEEHIMKRITILAAAGALVATPALGAWAAYANTGSDDTPAAHVRVHARHGADDALGHVRHARHGADDTTTHVRHARHGADDAPGHQRHSGEPEPGDDHGVRGEVEPGDDHGGQGEPEPGDDHGGDDGGHHGGDDGGHHGGDDGGHHGGSDD
jgi:hypothetical protein